MLEEKLDVLVVADVIDEDTKKYILGYLSGKKSKLYEEGETVELNRKYPY